MAIRTRFGKSEVKVIKVRSNGRIDTRRASDGTIFPNVVPDYYEADGGWDEIQEAIRLVKQGQSYQQGVSAYKLHRLLGKGR